MKKRNPLAVVLLSLITLGIYDIYWLVQTKKELNQKTNYHVPTIWLLVAPFLLPIAGFILLVANTHSSPGYHFTAAGDSVANTTTSQPGGLIGVLLIVVGFIAMAGLTMFWFFRFSKAINQYTQGKMNTATTFLILWLIHLIGVALIQDTFNDMLSRPQVAPTFTAPSKPAS